MQFREQSLTNGLQIVAECNLDAHSIAIAFCVNTGSRDEEHPVSGFLASVGVEYKVAYDDPGTIIDM